MLFTPGRQRVFEYKLLFAGWGCCGAEHVASALPAGQRRALPGHLPLSA